MSKTKSKSVRFGLFVGLYFIAANWVISAQMGLEPSPTQTMLEWASRAAVLLISIGALYLVFRGKPAPAPADPARLKVNQNEYLIIHALFGGGPRTQHGLMLRMDEINQSGPAITAGIPTRDEITAALSRLVSDGLVKKTTTRGLEYYQLTDSGHTALAGADRGGVAER